MNEDCLCGARIGERHVRPCRLTGVRQPVQQMSTHPSLYKRPLLTEKERARIQHRIDNLDGCNDDECDICWPSTPFAEVDE